MFSGNFSRNGRVSGTWTDTSDGSGGTFTGSRIVVTLPDEESGNVSISGNDSNVIGTSFTPNPDPAIINYGTGTIIVIWNQSFLSGGEFESRLVSFSFNENDRSVNHVGYVRSTGTGTDVVPTSAYSYSLDCGDNPIPCLSIILDVTQQQVTFNSTTLAVVADSGNDATAVIVMTGTLSW